MSKEQLEKINTLSKKIKKLEQREYKIKRILGGCSPHVMFRHPEFGKSYTEVDFGLDSELKGYLTKKHAELSKEVKQLKKEFKKLSI